MMPYKSLPLTSNIFGVNAFDRFQPLMHAHDMENSFADPFRKAAAISAAAAAAAAAVASTDMNVSSPLGHHSAYSAYYFDAVAKGAPTTNGYYLCACAPDFPSPGGSGCLGNGNVHFLPSSLTYPIGYSDSPNLLMPFVDNAAMATARFPGRPGRIPHADEQSEMPERTKAMPPKLHKSTASRRRNRTNKIAEKTSPKRLIQSWPCYCATRLKSDSAPANSEQNNTTINNTRHSSACSTREQVEQADGLRKELDQGQGHEMPSDESLLDQEFLATLGPFECAKSFIRRRNARERERVRCVNAGYESLRRRLPLASTSDRRLAKVEILRGAISYINNLKEVLEK